MDRVNGKRLIAYTACVFLGMWLMASIHAAMGGLQTSMIDAYSLSDSGKGVPSGTLTLFSVIAYFAVLLLIGRVHKAVMLLAGAVIAAIGLLPIHFDLPYSLFLAVLAAVGAGVGITDALASSSVNDLYTGPAGARVMCALHATYGLAGFVMPFLVRAMTGAGVSWRSVFMTLGFGEMFASAAILAVTRGHARELEGSAEVRPVSASDVKRYFGNRRLVGFSVVMFMVGLYLNGVLVWTPRYMELGLESGLSAFVLPAVYLGLTTSRLLMAFVRVPMMKYMRAMQPLGGVCLAVAVLSGSPVVSLVMIFLGVFAIGPVIPFTLNLAGREDEKKRFMITIVAMLIMMAGQTVYAPIYGKAESVFGARNALLLTAGVQLLTGVAAALVPGERKK